MAKLLYTSELRLGVDSECGRGGQESPFRLQLFTDQSTSYVRMLFVFRLSSLTIANPVCLQPLAPLFVSPSSWLLYSVLNLLAFSWPSLIPRAFQAKIPICRQLQNLSKTTRPSQDDFVDPQIFYAARKTWLKQIDDKRLLNSARITLLDSPMLEKRAPDERYPALELCSSKHGLEKCLVGF